MKSVFHKTFIDIPDFSKNGNVQILGPNFLEGFACINGCTKIVIGTKSLEEIAHF